MDREEIKDNEENNRSSKGKTANIDTGEFNFYIDEFYLMMQKMSSADYVSQIWKRARKWD